MPTTEELLAQLEAEAQSETPVCIIDPETRTITVPPEYQLLGVENDKRVERLHFQCPKIVGDNKDLSQDFILFINYVNANGDPDAYKIEDMQVDGDNITFSWLLEEKVTLYQGNIQISFCGIIPGDDQDDPDKNRWGTTINTDCTCLVGLKCTQQVAESNPDALVQIWAAIDELKAGDGGSGTPGKDGVGIDRIEKTSTQGLVDTYTIYLTDESTHTFTVTNGKDGNPGAKGDPGEDGITPTIGENGNWYLGETDTGKPSRGEKGDPGNKGDPGDKGDPGPAGETPNIQIGTVQTLDPGQQATASITGTPENPLLNLGIPRGKDGESSTGDGDSGAVNEPVILEYNEGYVIGKETSAQNKGKLVDLNNDDVNHIVSKPVDVTDCDTVLITGWAYSGYGIYSFLDSSGTCVAGMWSEKSLAEGADSIEDQEVSVPDGAETLIIAGSRLYVVPALKKVRQGSANAKPLSGIKWTAMGDSLTEDNSRTTKHYFDYISERTGVEVVNMGDSGTGYKKGEDDNAAFYQRASDIPIDTDIVTVFGSGNDLTLALGTPTDTGTNTICGCVNTTIDNIYDVVPTARLIIVSPTPWQSYNPANEGNAMDLYSKALGEICRRRGIPFLDLYHCSGLRPWDSEFRTLAYSKDDGNGVHPDETGHEIISWAFQSAIEGACQVYGGDSGSGESYELPIMSDTQLGGGKAVAKTDEDVPVAVDSETGQLFVPTYPETTGSSATPRQEMQNTDTTVTLEPNKLYVFPEMASLTVTLGTPTDSNVANEYHFFFTSGATATTLTLNDVLSDAYSIEANMKYEVSILEGVAYIKGVSTNET